MKTAIRTVLFDFGGVLAEEGFAEGLRTLAREQGLDPDRLVETAMDAVYDSGYVLGRGGESEFWRLLRRRSGLQGDDATLRQVILHRFRVRQGMIALVDVLRRNRLLVGLLSDQTDWLDRLDEEQHFYPHLDVRFVSDRLGKGKRDATLFTDVAHYLWQEPRRILFIDDNPQNVARARNRGLEAVRFRDEGALREQLAGRGLLP